MFAQNRNFYENNMASSDPAKVVHGLMDTNVIAKKKQPKYLYEKTRVRHFAVHHNKSHAVPTMSLQNLRNHQQQHASQILQIPPLLKTIRK